MAELVYKSGKNARSIEQLRRAEQIAPFNYRLRFLREPK